MTSLPDRPNLDQLRTQAKELKRAVADGDQAARDRVLVSHPKYAGRPPERLGEAPVTLRDAQVTIARELGFESWRALLDELAGPTVTRWSTSADYSLIKRAFQEMEKLRTGYCTLDHFLLALLNPDQPTIALRVLNDLGLTYELATEQSKKWHRPTKKGGRSTPVFHMMQGWAQGIAVGLGSAEVTDEIALLALAYGVIGDSSSLNSFELQADEVVEKLRDHGVTVPSVAPPISSDLTGPHGPWVYFPEEDLSTVTQAIIANPIGQARWGMNKSKWKKGCWYVHGEDDIPIEEIVRKALSGKSKDSIEVLPLKEGIDLEHAGAPRRYRERPPAATVQ